MKIVVPAVTRAVTHVVIREEIPGAVVTTVVVGARVPTVTETAAPVVMMPVRRARLPGPPPMGQPPLVSMRPSMPRLPKRSVIWARPPRPPRHRRSHAAIAGADPVAVAVASAHHGAAVTASGAESRA